MSTFDPDWCIAPGETLREWMDDNNLPPAAAAKACGNLPLYKFDGILGGQQRIGEPEAYRLEHGTGIPARLWLNLERAYRAGLAAGKKDITGEGENA